MVLKASNIYYLALYRKLGPWLRTNGGHLLSQKGFSGGLVLASLPDCTPDHKAGETPGMGSFI